MIYGRIIVWQNHFAGNVTRKVPVDFSIIWCRSKLEPKAKHVEDIVKVSVYIATSLDGYIARQHGELDWLPTPENNQAEDYGYSDFIKSVDVIVMGRATFDKVLSFGDWPYGTIKVIVLSHSNLPESVPDTVVRTSGSAMRIYQELVDSGVQHVYLDGGKTIQAFLAAGLVDEMIITTVPVLIGSGIPLFGALEHDVELILASVRSFENGLVQSHYRVKRETKDVRRET